MSQTHNSNNQPEDELLLPEENQDNQENINTELSNAEGELSEQELSEQDANQVSKPSGDFWVITSDFIEDGHW